MSKSDKRKARRLITICIVLVLAFVVVAAYFVLRSGSSSEGEFEVAAEFYLACDDAQITCWGDAETHRLELIPGDPNIPTLKKLTMVLSAKHKSMDSSLGSKTLSIPEIKLHRAWFEGRDMFMGQHYLTSSDQQTQPGEMSIQGMIPVCAVDQSMVWLLVVEYKIASKAYRALIELRSLIGH